MNIAAVEDVLIAECKAALGSKVRGVESLPGDWDDEMLNRLVRAVPGVFVVFGGGPRRGAPGEIEASINARFTVITATGHASGEAARRRGDRQQVGAYELLSVLVPRLHGFTVPNVGTLALDDVGNLYSGVIDTKGLAVYTATFSVPLKFELVADPELLAPFETFDVKFDVPPMTPAERPRWLADDFTQSRPDAHDTVVLPQP